MLKEIQTENLIAQLFDNQPDSVVWFRPIFKDNETANEIIDFEAQYANHAAARILGVPRSEVVGTRLCANHLMDEASIALIYKQCLEVWTTGQPIEYTYHSPGFDRYFNVQRSKVEDGILSLTRDRTKEVKAELEQQEQERMYQQILDTAADGIMLLKAVRNAEGSIIDFRIAHCNRRGIETGRFPAEPTGKTLLELLPHLRHTHQFDLHKQVVETGEPVRFETSFRTMDGEEYGWFIVSLNKMGDGVISNFVDVTERELREQQIIEQKDLLNNILNASLGAVYTCEAVRNSNGIIVDLRFVQVNQNFKELSVKPGLDVIGKNLLKLFPATRNTETFDQLKSVIETGAPARFEVHYHSDGIDGWYDTSAVKVGENGVVVTFANITELKQTVSRLEQQNTLLDNILKHSANGISVTQVFRNEEGAVIDGITILANDAAVNYIGIPREIYLTKTAVELDPNIIQSHYYQLCIKTLETGEPQFTQYYLALTNRWLQISISRLSPDHLITIFTDVTSSKEAQMRQQQLMQELKRSNESLEEFTSAASHDLKEPIRKVLFFADRLKTYLGDRLNKDEMQMVERMENASARMKQLVDDLLEFSHVSSEQHEQETVDLNAKLQLVSTDLELLIAEKNGVVNAGPLPTLKGYRRQLQQLFQNLISNALKYSKPDTPPVVTIQSRLVTGADSGFTVAAADEQKTFHLIEVKDNGIGFEQAYAAHIFNIFTRLHGKNEYGGTGIGLAIVRKVVENHKGYIAAQGEPGVGATFQVLLPA